MTAAAVIPKTGRPVRVTTLAPWNRLSRKPLEQVDAVVQELNTIASSRTGVVPQPEPENDPSARKSLVVTIIITLYLFDFSEFVGFTMYRAGERPQGLAMAAAGLGPLGAGIWSIYHARRTK